MAENEVVPAPEVRTPNQLRVRRFPGPVGASEQTRHGETKTAPNDRQQRAPLLADVDEVRIRVRVYRTRYRYDAATRAKSMTKSYPGVVLVYFIDTIQYVQQHNTKMTKSNESKERIKGKREE